MKYLKIYEDFNINEGVIDRMRRVLNLIGISVKHAHKVSNIWKIIDLKDGTVVNVCDKRSKAVKYIQNNLNNLEIRKGIKVEHTTDKYIFFSFDTGENNLIFNILETHCKRKGIGIDVNEKTCFIDSNGFIIDNLEYKSSNKKDVLQDPTEISFRTRKSDNSTISVLLKYVIQHFSNCSDKISYNGVEEIEIPGIGKFVEQYLKLNKSCNKDVIISKKMANFFIKNSNGNYHLYGNLQKNYPLIYQMLLNANSEINKSSSMSDMGFGD